MDDAVVIPPNSKQVELVKRRKLNSTDLKAVAELVINSKLTETEACRVLNINVQQWWVFKSRKKNTPEFESICSRIRGFTIQNAMQTIEDCGNGIGMKQPDWRAHAFRLQVIAPERFSPQQQAPQQPASSVSDQAIQLLCDMARKVYGELGDSTKPKQIGPIVEVESASTTDVKQVDTSQ